MTLCENFAMFHLTLFLLISMWTMKMLILEIVFYVIFSFKNFYISSIGLHIHAM